MFLCNEEKQSNYDILKSKQNAVPSSVCKYLLKSIQIAFPGTVVCFMVMVSLCSFSGTKQQPLLTWAHVPQVYQNL